MFLLDIKYQTKLISKIQTDWDFSHSQLTNQSHPTAHRQWDSQSQPCNLEMAAQIAPCHYSDSVPLSTRVHSQRRTRPILASAILSATKITNNLIWPNLGERQNFYAVEAIGAFLTVVFDVFQEDFVTRLRQSGVASVGHWFSCPDEFRIKFDQGKLTVAWRRRRHKERRRNWAISLSIWLFVSLSK